MRCALISDVHANKYALAAVLASIEATGVDVLVNAGDTFGYYPWAQEVFDRLLSLRACTVLGNHDALILGGTPGDPLPSYWDAIEHNRRDLAPAAWAWLRALPNELRLTLGGRPIRVIHGTPDDPLCGRLYPDHQGLPAWFPAEGEVLVFGHTHYPMVERRTGRGLLVNPGSVGQPRDGDPRASWALLNTKTLEVTVNRVEYRRRGVMDELRARGWNERSVQALDKTRKGPLVI